MKNTKFVFTVIFILFTLSLSAFAQNEKPAEKPKLSEFNEKLANEVGADDYGMKQYVFVVLKTGKAKITDKKEVAKLQAGHMANIGRLAEQGKLVLAGPFLQGGNNRGIYVFNVKTIEEAKELVKTDPAIKVGYFDVEFTKWYGSAALMKLNEMHKKVQKKSM